MIGARCHIFSLTVVETAVSELIDCQGQVPTGHADHSYKVQGQDGADGSVAGDVWKMGVRACGSDDLQGVVTFSKDNNLDGSSLIESCDRGKSVRVIVVQ